MIFKVLKDDWCVLPAAMKGKQGRVWGQGGLVSRKFSGTIRHARSTSEQGAAFSSWALSHTIHGQALHGLQINNNSLGDILGLSH